MSVLVPRVSLNDGGTLPQLGIGTWQIPDDAAPTVIADALVAGYRAVDTAAAYENEKGVGEGIRRAGLPRQAVAVTTKLWNNAHGYEKAMRAFDASLTRLGLDYVDLYLIHWPVPMQELYVDTWKALAEVKKNGGARSVGVSNFSIEHLQRLIDETGIAPSVNQVELHPFFQQTELRAFHARHGIATQSWSPLGQGALLSDPVLERIARKHGKTPAQVVIRWHMENGLIVIPKSVRAERLRENLDVFDFSLEAEDLAAVAGLDASLVERARIRDSFDEQ